MADNDLTWDNTTPADLSSGAPSVPASTAPATRATSADDLTWDNTEPVDLSATVNPPTDSNDPGAWNAALHGAAAGATLGFSDELRGLGNAAFGSGDDFWTRYGQSRDLEREAQRRAQEAHPYIYGAGEIAGSLPTIAAFPEFGLGDVAGIGGAAARAATTGAAAGAVQGAGEGQGIGDRAYGAVTGGLSGGALAGTVGAAIPTAGALFRRGSGVLERSLNPEDNAVAQAAQRLSDVTDMDVRVPRGVSDERPVVNLATEVARKNPLTGDLMQDAYNQGQEDIARATEHVADQFGQGNPANVAGRASNEILGQATAEDQAAQAAHDAEIATRSQAADAADEAARSDLQQGVGGEGVHPLDAGRAGADAVRDAFAERQRSIGARYDRINRDADWEIGREEGPNQFANNIEDRFAERGDPTDEISDFLGRLRNVRSVARGNRADMPPRATPGMAADEVRNPAADIGAAPSAETGDLDRADIIAALRRTGGQGAVNNWVKSHPAPSTTATAADEAPRISEAVAGRGGIRATHPGHPELDDLIGELRELQNESGNYANKPGLAHVEGQRGLRPVVSPNGMDIDDMAEALIQDPAMRFSENGERLTPQKLVDLLKQDMSGKPVWPDNRAGFVSRGNRRAAAEAIETDNAAHERAIRDAIDEEHGGLDDAAKDRVYDEFRYRADIPSQEEIGRAVNKTITGLEGERGFPGDNAADDVVNGRGLIQFLKGANRQFRSATGERRYLLGRAIGDLHQEIEDAVREGRFRGERINFSDLQAANADYKRLMNDFGYNSKEPDAKFIRGIIEGTHTNEDVAALFLGRSKLPDFKNAAATYRRIMDVTGNDPAVRGNIVRGLFSRIVEGTEGGTSPNAEAVVSGIRRLINGSGRDFANEVLTDDERRLWLAYANRLDASAGERETIADLMKRKPEIGEMRKLADDLLGKSGTMADEALFRRLDGWARDKGRANIDALGRLMRALPENLKGQVAGAMIRGLGRDPADTVNGFSLAQFAKNWNAYSPQAKALLFGNAGAHRQALDDIATIAQRYSQVSRRFGNPSGTAQHGAFMALFYGLLHHPVSGIATALAGRKIAQILASPQTSRRTATLLKAAQAVDRNPTPEALSSYRRAAIGLRTAAAQIGVSIPEALTNHVVAVTQQQRHAPADRARQR